MKIDYSKVEKYGAMLEHYKAVREANDAVVLSIAKAMNDVCNVSKIEARDMYGTSYTVGEFHFSIGRKGKDRLTVSGNYHDHGLSVQPHELKDRQPDSATMDFHKSPEQIVKEIARRVCPGFAANKEALAKLETERNGAARDRNSTVEEIAKMLGGRIHREGGGFFTSFAEVGNQETLSVYCPSGVPGYRFSVTPGGYTTVERVSFSNPDKAIALAKFLVSLKEEK
jgi:hypothetical protein